MRSTWSPQTTDLDAYARDHLEYEIRMLLQQFGHLETRWNDVQAGKRTDLGADGQACLEAVLVHLRLLEDFLGNRKQKQSVAPWWKPWHRRRTHDDVFAQHWNPSWKPKQFLGADRRKVNGQLMHVSARRPVGGGVQPGELADMVERCCRGLEEFFATLDPQRLTAFTPAPPLPPHTAPKRVDDYLHHRAARAWAN